MPSARPTSPQVAPARRSRRTPASIARSAAARHTRSSSRSAARCSSSAHSCACPGRRRAGRETTPRAPERRQAPRGLSTGWRPRLPVSGRQERLDLLQGHRFSATGPSRRLALRPDPSPLAHPPVRGPSHRHPASRQPLCQPKSPLALTASRSAALQATRDRRPSCESPSGNRGCRKERNTSGIRGVSGHRRPGTAPERPPLATSPTSAQLAAEGDRESGTPRGHRD